MRHEEFVDVVDNEIKSIAFTSGISNSSALAEYTCRILEESNEVAPLDLASASLTVGSRKKRARIDAFGYDELDNALYAVVADAIENTGGATVTKTDADALFSQLTWFLEVAKDDRLRSDIPKTEMAAQFAWTIGEKWPLVEKVKLILVTNKTLSDRIRTYEVEPVAGKRTEAQIWDESRLFQLLESKTGREDTKIDLETFGIGGLPMLAVDSGMQGTSTYLTVVPGSVIASIFDRFGSRLLEGNVRGFLSTRGAVNKGIRATILARPERFLAFNNGITATATAIQKDFDGRLASIENLQIVNGGQTTASLYNFLKNEKASKDHLASVSVAMKLIVVDPEIAEDLVPEIAKYSNSQNKVSEADFFANSPFHRAIEEISKRLLAPAVGGRQTASKWYYIRARGAYENDRARAALTAVGLRKFDDLYPPKQKLDKTDLAKYHSIFNQKPYLARRGNQKNFIAFKDEVAPLFETPGGREKFGDNYFKQVVGTKILYDAAHKAVRESTWYEQGYLADLVTYGISKFIQEGARRGFSLPWDMIWQRQEAPKLIVDGIVDCARLSLVAFHDKTRRQQNVTEWTKSEDCWKAVKGLEYAPTPDMLELLVPSDKAREIAQEGRERVRLLSEVETLKYLAGIAPEYWDAIEKNPLVRVSPATQATIRLIQSGRAFELDKRKADSVMHAISRAADEGIQRPRLT
jgi:hypothetical protein